MDELLQTAGKLPDLTNEEAVPSIPDPGAASQGDATRVAILDAVVRCFAAQGWSGTNMSLVARETGMTRGKIQYYFPVLEDLKYAAIEHLNEQSRRNYFERIAPDASQRMQFDKGVDLMWDLARDPLHMALAEVSAAARTDAELRRRLVEIRAEDEAALDLQSSESFPALAAVGREHLQLARLFTTVFVNGLAAHTFPENTAQSQARLIAMLKECLAGYWTHRGVTGLNDAEPAAPSLTAMAATPAPDDVAENDERRTEALSLIQRAAALLAEK